MESNIHIFTYTYNFEKKLALVLVNSEKWSAESNRKTIVEAGSGHQIFYHAWNRYEFKLEGIEHHSAVWLQARL